LVNKVHINREYGLESLYVEAMYLEVIPSIYFVIISSIVIRFGRMLELDHKIRECHCVSTVCFVLVSLVGLWHYGSVEYYSSRLVSGLRSGDAVQTREYAMRLSRLNVELGRGNNAIEGVLGDLLDEVEAGDTRKMIAALGLVAMRPQAWEVSSKAHQRLVWEDPGDHIAQVRLASAKFELGMRKQSLETLLKLAAEKDMGGENQLALGIAQAKMGQWDAATVSFRAVMDQVGWAGKIGPSAWENGILSLTLSELPSDALRVHIERMTPYEWGAYFRQLGWVVFFPEMEIGSTGVIAPVDIMSQSGGGGTWTEEGIFLIDQLVSLRKRGYNIAVIDPVSGKLDGKANFDTWENKDEGKRLDYFIRAIPRGRIVAGTINDEGSGGLTRGAKNALREVGARRLPIHWGSHAFIGVKGSAPGTALESVANRFSGRVLLGVSSNSLPDSVRGNREDLERFLRAAARSEAGSKAILLSGNGSESTITIAEG
jgi:hypothetical protein